MEQPGRVGNEHEQGRLPKCTDSRVKGNVLRNNERNKQI